MSMTQELHIRNLPLSIFYIRKGRLSYSRDPHWQASLSNMLRTEE